MGTVKKTAPLAASPVLANTLSAAALALAPLLKLVVAALDIVRKVTPAIPFPQDGLRLIMWLRTAASSFKDSADALEALAEAHHAAKGSFEHGRMAILFKPTSKRSPKWKDEAIRLGRDLAALKKEEFDEEAFVEAILKGYPSVPGSETKIIESA